MSDKDMKDGKPEDAAKTPEKKVRKKPKNELQECQQLAAEATAGWQRAVADYQNLQKEAEKRVSESIKYGTEALLHELLPMVDHFKFAFAGIPEEERDGAWLKGIEHIQTNFMKILEEHGVEMIETVGAKFDPEVHEAVEEVEDGDGKPGTVAEEVASGFRLNGKLIQPAKVKVNK
ncbi:nucleotide exchange factor GrpE [Patescibacteria group bacterium]